MASETRLTLTVTLFVLTLTILQPGWCDPSDPVVQIDSCTITGMRAMVGNRSIRKFLGIPYAQAPTGNRRFSRTQIGTLPRHVNATRYGDRCPQLPVRSKGMSEDCLFLNIFTSDQPSDQLLPVFVWIHGGGYNMGTSAIYKGDQLTAEGEIVVVTFNHRLGPLGFLTTGFEGSNLSNNGLYDQVTALKWVRRYIESFGGDKSRITLAGMSAGASSASFLSLSPVSRTLFSQVIMMSGAASSAWALVSPSVALEAAKTLGRRLGCPSDEVSGNTLVECLRGQDWRRLMNASAIPFPDRFGQTLVDYIWGPVRDGVMIRSFSEAEPFSGPLMAGLVNNEGQMFLNWSIPIRLASLPNLRQLVTSRTYFRQQLIPTILKQAYPSLVNVPYSSLQGTQLPDEFSRPPLSTALASVECAYYRAPHQGADQTNNDTVSPPEFCEMLGDQAFIMGTLKFLRVFCRPRNSYLYYMAYQTGRPGVRGIIHADDAVFLMGFNTSMARYHGFRGHINEQDVKVSRHFRNLFFNFIKTGNPNNPSPPQGYPLWKPYTCSHHHYLHVSSTASMSSNLKADKMALWLEELPRLLTAPKNVTDRWQCQPHSCVNGKLQPVSGVPDQQCSSDNGVAVVTGPSLSVLCTVVVVVLLG